MSGALYDVQAELNQRFELKTISVERMPREFLEKGVSFWDRQVQMVLESYVPKGAPIEAPVPGVVLRVIKNGRVEPLGPRYQANQMSNIKSETCLKIWVHTPYDKGLSIPCNFITPGDDGEELIDDHYIFEASGEEMDKKVPSPGDVVEVIHPWAWGFRNKVGSYIGFLDKRFPPTCKKTKDYFKKQREKQKECGGREKNVPQSSEPTQTPAGTGRLPPQ